MSDPLSVPEGAWPPDLEPDYEACRQVVRAHARNFYYGLRLSPEPKRSAIYSIYAWMRRGDDDIDLAESPEKRADLLDQFSRRSERVFAGLGLDESAQSDPIWRAFAHTVSRFPVDRADLRGLLEGLREDTLNDARAVVPASGVAQPVPVYATRVELERYCYRVAGVVGLICIDIWGLRAGVDRAEARRLAAARGLAFQLTNILRDFAEDFDRARVYIPAEDFEAGRITPSEFRSWHDHPRCASLVRRIAGWAGSAYRESAPLDRMIEPACAPTLWAMTRIYARLLEKIDADPRRVVSHRVRVRAVHKAGIAVAAALRARVSAF